MGADFDHGEDDSLAGRIRAGDSPAFGLLYKKYFDSLVSFAYKSTLSRAIAQDVVADLFVSLWQKRKEWEPKFGVRAYLYTGVRNRIVNYLRDEERLAHRGEMAAAESSPPRLPIDAQMEIQDQLSAVWRVIQDFPELRRTVMFLRWEKGLTPEEIAAVLEISRNAVDQHLSRAMQALREKLPHLLRS